MTKKVVIEIEFPKNREDGKADLDYRSTILFLRDSGFKVKIIRQV